MKSLTVEDLDELTDSITAGYLLFAFDTVFFGAFFLGVYLLTLIWSVIASAASSPVNTPGVDASTILFYLLVALYMFWLRRLQDAMYYAVKIIDTESAAPIRQMLNDFGKTVFYEVFRLKIHVLMDLSVGLYIASVWYFGQQCFLTNYASPWYQSTLQWPAVVREVGCVVTEVSGDAVQYFFEATNIPLVTTALIDAFGVYFKLEEWRVKIRSAFEGTAWKYLNEGCHGSPTVYRFRSDPVAQTMAAVAAVTAAIACFVFFRVTRKLLDKMIFWMFGIAAILTAMVTSQVLYDSEGIFAYLTVPGVTWERVYTPTGYAAMYSGAAALVFALLSMILPAFADEKRVDVYQIEQQQRSNIITKALGAGVHYTKALVEFFFSETFIFVVISALLLIYIWLSRFPIQAVHFTSLNITKYPSYMDPSLNIFEDYWFNYKFKTVEQLEIDVADFLVDANFDVIKKLESYLPSIPGFTIPNYCLDAFFGPLIGAYEDAYNGVLTGYNEIVNHYGDAITIGNEALGELENAFSSKRQFIQSSQQAISILNHEYNFIAGLACTEGGVVAKKLDEKVGTVLSNLCNEFLQTQIYLKTAAMLFYGGEDLYNYVLSKSETLAMGAASAITGAYGSSVGWAEGAYKEAANAVTDFGNDVSNFFNAGVHHNTSLHLQATSHHMLVEKLGGHSLMSQERMNDHAKMFRKQRKAIDRILHRLKRHSTKLRFRTKSDSCPGVSLATLLNEIEIPFPDNGLTIPSISLSSLLEEATGDIQGLIKQLIGFLIPLTNEGIDALMKEAGKTLAELEDVLAPVVKLALTAVIDLYQVFLGLRLDLSWIPPWVYYGPVLLLLALVGVAMIGLVSKAGRRVSDAGMMNGFLYVSGLILSLMFGLLTARVVLEAKGYTFEVVWRSDVYVWLAAFVFIPLSLALLLMYESRADTVDAELIWLSKKLHNAKMPVLMQEAMRIGGKNRRQQLRDMHGSDEHERQTLLTMPIVVRSKTKANTTIRIATRNDE